MVSFPSLATRTPTTHSHCGSPLRCTTERSNRFSSFLSITVPPAHLREQFNHPRDPIHFLMTFGHSKAHLRLYKSLFSDFMSSPWRAYSKTNPAWLHLCRGSDVCVCACVCVWISLAASPSPPCSFSSETLTGFGFVYGCVWRECGGGEAMCQEEHMALPGCRHLPLDRWESIENH